MPKTDNTFQLNQATTKIIPICICLQVCISQPVRSLEHSCVNLYPIKTCSNTGQVTIQNALLFALIFAALTCGFTLREKGEHWFPRQISDLATENHFVNVNRLIERSFFWESNRTKSAWSVTRDRTLSPSNDFLSIIFGSSRWWEHWHLYASFNTYSYWE